MERKTKFRKKQYIASMQKLKEKSKKLFSFFIMNHTERAICRCSTKKGNLERSAKFKRKHPCRSFVFKRGNPEKIFL